MNIDIIDIIKKLPRRFQVPAENLSGKPVLFICNQCLAIEIAGKWQSPKNLPADIIANLTDHYDPIFWEHCDKCRWGPPIKSFLVAAQNNIFIFWAANFNAAAEQIFEKYRYNFEINDLSSGRKLRHYYTTIPIQDMLLTQQNQ